MGREIESQDRSEPARPSLEADVSSREPETASREREPVVGRNFAYCLSPAELQTMKDIGRFRTIDARDLEQFRYGGDRSKMREDLRSLKDQGLISRRTIWTGKQGDGLTVLVSTKRGKALLQSDGKEPGDQKIFSGFVKPAEVQHDAAIYRMYQAEAAKIEGAGGRIRRVVLDYELKQKVYRPVAKLRAKSSPGSTEYTRRQAEIASQNGLKVIGGKILLPDLRIEYDTATGERGSVDLELATHHYRGSSLRAKAEAGFKIYAPQDSAAGIAAYDPERMTEIFSF
jgi:hypothetical protein